MRLSGYAPTFLLPTSVTQCSAALLEAELCLRFGFPLPSWQPRRALPSSSISVGQHLDTAVIYISVLSQDATLLSCFVSLFSSVDIWGRCPEPFLFPDLAELSEFLSKHPSVILRCGTGVSSSVLKLGPRNCCRLERYSKAPLHGCRWKFSRAACYMCFYHFSN